MPLGLLVTAKELGFRSLLKIITWFGNKGYNGMQDFRFFAQRGPRIKIAAEHEYKFPYFQNSDDPNFLPVCAACLPAEG